MPGRRKKVLKNHEKSEKDWTDFDRKKIRTIFAQHITNISKELNDVKELEINVQSKRNKRSYDEISEIKCQNAMQVLLEQDAITQSLLAASVLWGYWNHNITEITITRPVFHEIVNKLEHINKHLGRVGPWSALIGRQATNWIHSFIDENIINLPVLRYKTF